MTDAEMTDAETVQTIEIPEPKPLSLEEAIAILLNTHITENDQGLKITVIPSIPMEKMPAYADAWMTLRRHFPPASEAGAGVENAA